MLGVDDKCAEPNGESSCIAYLLSCKTYNVLSLTPSSLAALRCQTYNVMIYRAKCGVLLQYPMLRGETNYVLGLMPSSFPSPLVELCDKYHVLRSMPSSFAVPDAEFFCSA